MDDSNGRKNSRLKSNDPWRANGTKKFKKRYRGLGYRVEGTRRLCRQEGMRRGFEGGKIVALRAIRKSTFHNKRFCKGWGTTVYNSHILALGVRQLISPTESQERSKYNGNTNKTGEKRSQKIAHLRHHNEKGGEGTANDSK